MLNVLQGHASHARVYRERGVLGPIKLPRGGASSLTEQGLHARVYCERDVPAQSSTAITEQGLHARVYRERGVPGPVKHRNHRARPACEGVPRAGRTGPVKLRNHRASLSGSLRVPMLYRLKYARQLPKTGGSIDGVPASGRLSARMQQQRFPSVQGRAVCWEERQAKSVCVTGLSKQSQASPNSHRPLQTPSNCYSAC